MRWQIWLGIGLLTACGSKEPSPATAPSNDASIDLGAPFFDDAGAPEASVWPEVDGGFVVDASVVAADRFITKVVSFTLGACGGFGQDQLPGIVQGPPIGGGADQGSVDVASLGTGGEIVVSFEPNAIVDGPGVDLLVFENPFYIGGSASDVYAEPGEVSVSDDGATWYTFPCDPPVDAQAAAGVGPPYGSCAGWHPVYSNPDDGLSPVDPGVAGGDSFDLADLGLKRARFVRVRDKTQEACPATGPQPKTNGFDLDAMSIVNAAVP